MEDARPIEGGMMIGEKLEVIRIGAEAIISRLEWNGFKMVSKHRVPKPYRFPELDRWIRDRRTLHEARVITSLRRLGIPCPAILLMDRSEATLYLQLIEGVELKKVLDSLPAEEVERLANELGRMVGRMHRGGVAHGDLTTSNIMLDRMGNLYLIDFGLSAITDDLEELAVDIHLLDRSLESVHHRLRAAFMRSFLKGYATAAGMDFLQALIEKVKEIRSRGRYVEERRKRH
ncbi:MAG: Kae1-associated kinase Bud32 [Thaumarchaeota archaeon]|jgi:TP53 regulating kinase-like protein|nr:Kae1-associated kinase Bud32 [Nitrososphaerota archaeon]MCL7386561.1 Kae1-associated kinase Bud32 [Candidatus Wolframiiraptor allenii]MCL7393272.1 Kae1-associated kinase Bud32 [Candidatus Wolframiiraptor allenii]